MGSEAVFVISSVSEVRSCHDATYRQRKPDPRPPGRPGGQCGSAEGPALHALENMTIDLTIPLLGGKVHGSLARAGKVRGQTPKVEAGEKKKKKTGRAKRRIQYNRRFVN